jgi:hypothetical protein
MKDSRQRIKEFEEKTRYGVEDSFEERGPGFAREYQYKYTLGNIKSISDWHTNVDSAKLEAANAFVIELKAAGYIR